MSLQGVLILLELDACAELVKSVGAGNSVHAKISDTANADQHWLFHNVANCISVQNFDSCHPSCKAVHCWADLSEVPVPP